MRPHLLLCFVSGVSACYADAECVVESSTAIAWDEEAPDGSTPEAVFEAWRARLDGTHTLNQSVRDDVTEVTLDLLGDVDQPRWEERELKARRRPSLGGGLTFTVRDCVDTLFVPVDAEIRWGEDAPYTLEGTATVHAETQDAFGAQVTPEALTLRSEETPAAWDTQVSADATVSTVLLGAVLRDGSEQHAAELREFDGNRTVFLARAVWPEPSQQ